MNFNPGKNFECREMGERRESARDHFSRWELRCHLDSGNSSSTTNNTAINKQTTVQASGAATVTGADNKGVSNSSGVAIVGSKNTVTVTTADPAIVESALQTNSLIATEALATFDHLVTGQTAGQLQAQQESQASSDAVVAGATAGIQPFGFAAPDDSSGGTATVAPVSIGVKIAVAVLIVAGIGIAYAASKGKFKTRKP